MPGSKFYCKICKRTIVCSKRRRQPCIRYHYWTKHRAKMMKGVRKRKKK